MIDKRPKTPREVAAFSLFSMAEEGAWSDGALHHYLSRAGLDGRDAALAARLTYGTVQNELLLDWYPLCGLKRSRRACSRVCAWDCISSF